MGVASLVLGIISLLVGIIPIIGIVGLGLAIIGIILGIIDWVQKKKKDEKHGQAIAGVVCSSISIVIILIYTISIGVFTANALKGVDQKEVQNFIDTIEKMEQNENYYKNYNRNYNF